MTSISQRQDLVLDNISMAQRMARFKKRNLFSVSLDELESAAYLGLVQAANSFEDDLERFQAYAACRIAGAIQDYLRELQWGSRQRRWQRQPEGVLEDMASNDEQYDDAFDGIVAKLPEVWQAVMKQYYLCGAKVRDIAFDFGFEEGRVYQILCESRSRLRKIWGDQRCEF